MINFWVVAALFVMAALFFIVPTLWRRHARATGVERDLSNIEIYRDQLAALEADLTNDTITQEQFEQSKLELERRLLEEVHLPDKASAVSARDDSAVGRGAAIIIMLLFPALATLIYVVNKNPDVDTPQEKLAQGQLSEEQPGQMAQPDMQQIEEMVASLAERMKEDPSDPRGWVLLGRSYFQLGRYPLAVEAYEQASKLLPDNADVLTDYADALAMANDRKLAGKPMEIITRALQLNPNAQKALWLAGTAAFDARDYKGAIRYWEQLLKQFPPESDAAKTISANVEEARNSLNGKPTAANQQTGTDTGNSAAQVSGVISLNPELAGRVAATDVVFIFARAAQGPRMPLAVLRKQVKDLPISFRLDDSMAAMPAARLSNATEVMVEARISKSGNAMAKSGDLEGGTASAVKVGANDIKIVIDRIVP